MVTIQNLQELSDKKETIIFEQDLQIFVKQNEDKDYEYSIYKLEDNIQEDYPIDNGIINYDDDENLIEITNQIMKEVISIKTSGFSENYFR